MIIDTKVKIPWIKKTLNKLFIWYNLEWIWEIKTFITKEVRQYWEEWVVNAKINNEECTISIKPKDLSLTIENE